MWLLLMKFLSYKYQSKPISTCSRGVGRAQSKCCHSTPMGCQKGCQAFDTPEGVPAGHNSLTPQIGVTLTPLFLQCMYQRWQCHLYQLLCELDHTTISNHLLVCSCLPTMFNILLVFMVLLLPRIYGENFYTMNLATATVCNMISSCIICVWAAALSYSHLRAKWFQHLFTVYFIPSFHTVNVGLAVGLSVGLTFLLLFIGIPICVVCVIVCVAANKRSRPITRTHIVATTPPAAGTTVVTTSQTTSAAAPATQPVQQYYPADFNAQSQEAPPPYPASGYPAYPPPVPQVYIPL